MANIPLCNHFQPSVMVVATERNPVSDVNDKISIVHQASYRLHSCAISQILMERTAWRLTCGMMQSIIGVSVGESHTSELNGGIYVSHVAHPCSACIQTLCTWSNWEHVRTLLYSDFIVVYAACSEQEYVLPEKLWNHCKARKTGYCTHENERENPTSTRNSRAKARKIDQAERDRARHSTQTAWYINLSYCALCIANVQYIRNYHVAYKYML